MPLVGTCSQCGACCRLRGVGGDVWTCEHLAVTGSIGSPQATRCRVYDARWDGMPIWTHTPDGRQRRMACFIGGSREEEIIRRTGIAQGCCTLTWEDPAMDRTGHPKKGVVTEIKEVGDYLRIRGVVEGRSASIDVPKPTLEGLTRREVERFGERRLQDGVE